MTLNEIFAMKPGPELDALVDRYVFDGDGCVHDLYWVDPDEYACSKCQKQFLAPEPWHYSTDIYAAWRVVERMRSLGYSYGARNSVHGSVGWHFKDADDYIRGTTHADHEPEAICKAALLVVT